MQKKDTFMDIISLPIELDRKVIDSRYRLARVAAQRAAELSLGADPKIEQKAKKVTTTAILEVLSGKISYLTGDEALHIKEKIDKIDIKKMLEEKRRAIPDISELEKDLKIYLHGKEPAEKMLEELFGEEPANPEENE